MKISAATSKKASKELIQVEELPQEIQNAVQNLNVVSVEKTVSIQSYYLVKISDQVLTNNDIRLLADISWKASITTISGSLVLAFFG